jgi:alkanesulfonate monooxygenase SsuD/methylene tetrahydromethanopterin reductase-like flavin-dependent oxidoreductase (luciferase family)
MTIEFIGIAATAPHSETEIAATQSGPVQPGYLEELARAHEEAGFDRVQGAAAPYGRAPRFSVSLRPIPAATETEAWQRATDILELTRERARGARQFFNLGHSQQHGSQRLLEFAAQGDVDPLDDVVQWGRELVPLLREQAARTPLGEPDAAEGALTA